VDEAPSAGDPAALEVTGIDPAPPLAGGMMTGTAVVEEPTTGRGLLWWFGLTIVVGSAVLAVVGPVIGPYDPTVPTPDISVPPPSLPEVPGLLRETLAGDLEQPVHWFGTDSAGLDVFSRVLAAPRIDVSVGVSATVLSLVVGSLLGLLAGYSRGRGAEALVRTSDVFQSFPIFILAMILVVLTGRNTLNIVLTLAALFVPIYLRLTRSQVVVERTRTYVEAARVMGNREATIAVRHVLPNSLGPALIQASVTIGWAILLTAGLSFVGAGVRPPTAEWGGMIASGANLIILGEWWPSVFPGVAISVTVFGYAVLGNALEHRYGNR
jgi:peptide/nickel transport system permease protein